MNIWGWGVEQFVFFFPESNFLIPLIIDFKLFDPLHNQNIISTIDLGPINIFCYSLDKMVNLIILY